jgi:hypothetical protein
MQKPFTLTDEMQKELADEISTLAPQTHDPVGESPYTKRLQRGQVNVLHSKGTEQRSSVDQTVPREEAINSEAVEEALPVERLTQERRQTHGNFRDNARLSQKLKSTFRSTAAWDYLDDVEKESLDMIALKISRILSGKSLERQHWEDVEGYAHLAVKECE